MNCNERLFGFAVSQTTKILQQRVNAIFNEEDIGITIEQWPILMILSLYPDSTQQDLAQETNKDKTTVTRLINNMVKNDLLERKSADKDRRKNTITVTPEGARVREKVLRTFRNYELGLLEGITDEEFQITLSVLLRMVGNIGHPVQVEMLKKHLDNIHKCNSNDQ